MKRMKNYLMNFLAMAVASACMIAVLTSCDDDNDAPTIDPPRAIFEFEIDDQTGTATFTNLSVDADAYSWDFGDGQGSSTDANPTYTYSATGAYTVTLTATNEAGEDDANQTVTFVANLVTGGDMSDESAWTFKQVWNDPDNAVAHGFENGEYKFDNADGTLYSQSYLWQQVALEAGKTYTFEADVRSAGTSSIWFEVYFGQHDPDSVGDYGNQGKRVYLSSFDDPNSGCANGAFDDDINVVSQNGCASQDEGNANLIGADGTFTITADELTADGDIFLVFKTGSWDSADNYGDGLFMDNVSIKEVLTQ